MSGKPIPEEAVAQVCDRMLTAAIGKDWRKRAPEAVTAFWMGEVREALQEVVPALTAAQQQGQGQGQGGGEVVQRLRGVLEHGKMGDKCLIAPDLVTAAIAALSAQQSPAEAQPVAKLVNRKDADGGKTTTFIRPTSLGMDLPLGEYPLHLHPPPSAPVGVEGLLADLETIWHSVSDDKETNAAYQRLKSALAQQPAAARWDARRLVAKLAAHVRPTCSELWDEAQAFLAAQHQEPKP